MTLLMLINKGGWDQFLMPVPLYYIHMA